ncbi:MAG: 4-hydroxythreonine-4-phosphate dehydrogenase PdxA [Bacteroides sp.]|nr:4-hydroxythreonine-4-phosphate dehydrogenase PdxA [Bacteroidales bacterium]MBD5369013.1 4-hydroxythreonine-4-phosphate dehydrogenase PdxA [Bacteroides sp.]
MEQDKKIRVGISHGDINSIAYEVILKALEDERLLELCDIVVYGSDRIAAEHTKIMELPEIKFNVIESADDARSDRFNIINVVADDTALNIGQSTEVAGQAAFSALERAVTDLRAGDIDVLVTAPINKHNIHSTSFTFPGHTEYLESSLGNRGDALMIMVSDRLKVALVTIHLPIEEVAGNVTRELVERSILRLEESLKADFGIHKPRIAVLSLDPHVGDNGVIGKADAEIVAPAIADAKAKKVLCFGPYSADGFFGSGAYAKFDGVLAMYHDQGLTPFKLIAGDEGINFTAGLPYVRTSPDHGTAYDIAGKGQADPDSMRNAIYQAIDIYRSRGHHAEATANPLRKQNFDRGSDKLPREKKSNQ